MPVIILDPRGEVPEQKLKDAIEDLEQQGEVKSILFFQNSIMVHWQPFGWQPGGTEQR